MRTLNKRLRIAAAATFALFLAIMLPGNVWATSGGNTITLGAVVSVTGKYSTSGKFTRDGYNLAVERINAKGGILVAGKHYKLAIEYYDDESTSARAAQLAERMIKQDGIKFVLGPYSSALTKAIAPVTEKYRVPMVEGNGAARDLFQQGYRYLFAVLTTADYYLRPAIDLLAERAKVAGRDPGSMKIAIVTENDNFSQDVRAGIIAGAKHYGMQVIIDDKLPPGLNDMTVTLTKVKLLKPDALFVSAHAHGAPLVISQLATQRVYVPMLAMTHCKSGRIIKKYGAKANYALCAAQWDSRLGYAGRWFKSSAAFEKTVREKYGYKPPYQVAESAAAVIAFADAFERADSLDKRAVRDALAATDITTFYGPINFDSTGKNIAKSMVLYQVQNEQYTIVAPQEWANAKLIYPAPKWRVRHQEASE